MPISDAVYTLDFPVCDTDIDIQGRVSNVRYVAWMQDVAIAHSTACGWSMERYAALGQSWVVRQHVITYRRPAIIGDVVTAATWIVGHAPRRCLRRYAFWLRTDPALLADAETQWVYINVTNGRPLTVPPELLDAFAVEDADAHAVFHALTS
ncbi:MAG: acyl-CoA thioesterase [Desulfovibrio sp.]|nr:acyl-CoA thioesterase [Desulfovibrio sp.]